MSAPRPFRFGIQAAALPGADAPAEWAALARKAEDLGYDTLTVPDHFDGQLAPVPALMAAADATTTLRIGALVWCNDYRHPVVLAKEAATLDVLSGGRLEFGLGAGWMATDYERAGITLAPPGRRIARMEEAIDVIRGLFADGDFSYSGEHYHVSGLDGRPKPAQKPGPPILIGGGGRRMLEAAARHADIVGVNLSLQRGVIDASVRASATAAATEEKLRWIRDAAGSRMNDIELHVRVHVAVVTDDREGFASALGPAFGLPAGDALDSPHALAGTVDQLVDVLVERRERYGISYYGLSLDALEPLAPVVARLAGT
jgi:probable F420-dependent oxidoreductase